MSYNIELERYHKERFVEMNQQSKYKDSMFAVEVMVTMHSYNYLMVVLSHPNWYERQYFIFITYWLAPNSLVNHKWVLVGGVHFVYKGKIQTH